MNKILQYLKLEPVFSYFLRVFKKDKEGKYPNSTNLKLMHGINRVSIVMFAICMVILVYKLFFRQ